jgi:hypothetical protein
MVLRNAQGGVSERIVKKTDTLKLSDVEILQLISAVFVPRKPVRHRFGLAIYRKNSRAKDKKSR